METITAKDGTTIAIDRQGSGPAVVLVDGALCHRSSSPNQALAEALADRYTVYTYDRRGRGDSTDAAAYEPEREIEDLAAVIEAAGGEAYVAGMSSGAALALAAADAGLPITKVAAFEPPFIVDASRPPCPADFQQRMSALLADGKRGKAVKYFMRTGVNLPAPVVAMMPLMPAWSKLKAVAHTLPYDLAFVADKQHGDAYPQDAWAGVRIPALAIDGGKSPAWMRASISALAQRLPNAEYVTLPGQTHIVKAEALAPVLKEFFA